MIAGGYSEKGQITFDWKGALGNSLSEGQSSGSSDWSSSNVKYTPFKRTNYSAAPICVWLPFIWVVSNDTLGKNQKEINCSA